IFAAWLLGTLAHAAVAVEATRLARRLAGPWTGFAAGAMCLSFGAFAWFAWSGMETMALAWILLRCARLAGERCDGPAEGAPRASGGARALAWAGLVAPLIRPEGALGAALVALALVFGPRGGGGARERRWALAPALGVVALPVLHLVFAGHAAS